MRLPPPRCRLDVVSDDQSMEVALNEVRARTRWLRRSKDATRRLTGTREMRPVLFLYLET